LAIVFFLAFSSQAGASTIYGNFSFNGSDYGFDHVIAEMTVTITDNVLSAEIENKSIDYTDPKTSEKYSPAITGFGIDLNFGTEETSEVSDWDLKAYDNKFQSELVCIGGFDDNPSNTEDWILSFDKYQGIKVDYIPHTDDGVNGALYSTTADGPAGNTSYYTKAFFTIIFSQNISEIDLNTEDQQYYSPFMRFQNVGIGGEYSLKLPDPYPEVSVPEPATLLLLLSGISGLALLRRR